MIRKFLAAILIAMMALTASGCSKDRDNDVNVQTSQIKADPTAQDKEDQLFNEETDYEADIELQPGESWAAAYEEIRFSPDTSQFSQAVSITGTYGTRNGGRQAFRIKPRFGRKGQTAYVVFNDRPSTAYRVKLFYANRINSGSHRGFVLKLGSLGDFYCHSPYGRHPQTVRVYY